MQLQLQNSKIELLIIAKDRTLMKNQNTLLSIVVATKNNFAELQETLNSIHLNCDCNVEVIIIDGGNEIQCKKIISGYNNSIKLNIQYQREIDKGVFPAQNQGIKASNSQWIIVLNSGDLLTKYAKAILHIGFLRNFKEEQILVFSQDTYSEIDKKEYLYTPNDESIWPHQSIIVRKEVYDTYGVYREDFKYAAEQYYFAQIRKKVKFKIVNSTLTSYKLGGLSSTVNFKLCLEMYMIRKELGSNMIQAFTKSYIFPYGRKLLSNFISDKKIQKLKIVFFSHYRSTHFQ